MTTLLQILCLPEDRVPLHLILNRAQEFARRRLVRAVA